MESTRLQKIERLLQKELSDIFQKQTQGMHGVLVSVSVVRVSPDLSVARAYLSIFPSDKSQELLEAIRSNTKAIRFDLGPCGPEVPGLWELLYRRFIGLYREYRQSFA